jgi:hypothetical protein
MKRGLLIWTLAMAGATPLLRAQQPAPAPVMTGLAQRFPAVDLTGTWVSIVTEDWAVRMITPPKGDFESLPLTAAAQASANTFDLAQAEAGGRACDAYGAPALLRQPGRIRISWQDANTLRLETDAGEQTRVFRFAGGSLPAERGAPSRQGTSIATWQYAGGFDPIRAANPAAAVGGRGVGGRGGGGGGGRRGGGAVMPTGGKLKVETTNLTAGLLRKNGVPYSANTTLMEYFNLLTEPNGTQWLIVTTVVRDPENLAVDYIMSTNFRKEADDSKWKPAPCSLR